MAFLNKGLLITLTDERTTDQKTGEPKRAEFKYNGGIAEFIKHLNRGKSVLHDKPIYMEAERDEVAMEIALQYNDGYSETVFSFANNINTCLLYTSDAADEEDSVDLGGRRIIKKKTNKRSN